MVDEDYARALQPAVDAMLTFLQGERDRALEVSAGHAALEGAVWDATTRFIVRRLEMLEDSIERSSEVLMALFDMHAHLAGVDPETTAPHLWLVRTEED